MSGNSSKRRYVAVGLENPDGSLNGSMYLLETLSGMSFKPAGDVKKRDVVRPTMTNTGSRIGAKNWDLSLPVEAIGGGLNANVVQDPAMHPLLLASGMVAEAAAVIHVTALSGVPKFGTELTNTTTPGVVGTIAHVVVNASDPTMASLYVRNLQNAPVAADALAVDGQTATTASIDDAICYRPESDRTLYPSLMAHCHYDSQRRIATRTLVDWSFDWQAGDVGKFSFSAKGLYQTPTNETLPSPIYPELEPPIAESAALTLGNYPTNSGTIEKLSIKFGASIVAVPDINSPNGRDSYRIDGRNTTGSIDPESVMLSAFNPFTMWENGEKAAIFCTIGSTPGERISALVPGAQFTGISDKERAGSDAYDLPFDCTGQNDDEVYLFFH